MIVKVFFDNEVAKEKREKFLADVDRAVYYHNQNRKAMHQVELWLKWIVLPIVIALLIYGLFT